MLRNKSTVSSLEWAPNHFSWSLIDNRELSIKLEEIPVNGSSESHYHKKSLQFFFILEGDAILSVKGHRYQLTRHEGIEISPGNRHQIKNAGTKNLQFILDCQENPLINP
ncbi:MAG: cupin domain-containing protein [Promethearchaeota archaeon]